MRGARAEWRGFGGIHEEPHLADEGLLVTGPLGKFLSDELSIASATSDSSP